MPDTARSVSLRLPKDQPALVRVILQKHVPGKGVWAFGSRANGGSPKRFSDLDLAVEGELTWGQRAGLTEAFEESFLPIKVDIAELDLLTPDFQERIERDFVPVQVSAGGPVAER